MRDGLKIGLTGAALVALIGLPSAAFSQVAPPGGAEASDDELGEDVDAMVEEEAEEKRPWSVSAGLMTRVGQGVFVKQEADTEVGEEVGEADAFADRVVNVYSLSGSYTLEDFTFGLEMGFNHWLTRGGGYSAVPYSSNANEAQEFSFQDIGLTASWAGYNIEPIDTKVTANYAAYLPTSKISQTENLILTNVLGAGLSKTFFEKLTLSYSLSGLWLPHTTNAPTVSADVDTVQRNRALIDGAFSDVTGNGEVIQPGRNIEWGLANALSASFPIYEDLSFSASYSVTKYWTYWADNNDENRPEIRDDDGNLVADAGRGEADIVSTSVSLSYPVNDYLSLSGGLYSRGPAKSTDNGALRFPFWNTQGAANNFSAFQFSITGTY